MPEKKELTPEQLETVAGGVSSNDFRIVYEYYDTGNVSQGSYTSEAYATSNRAKQAIWSTLQAAFTNHTNYRRVYLMYEFLQASGKWTWYRSEDVSRSDLLG